MSGQVEVSRWVRFGHDRLYVSVDGVKVGHWDITAQTPHPETPDRLATVVNAAQRWLATRDAAAPAGLERREEPCEVPARPTPDRPWEDLAGNRAGAAVREQADREWAQAPVRNTIGRLLGANTSDRPWRVGAEGEEKVAAQIDKAIRRDPRWRVLHSVPVGTKNSDIDHVLIGPGGFFTINTKHHPDANIVVTRNSIKVNGTQQHYLRNSRFEAERASDLLTRATGLPIKFLGVIAVVGAILEVKAHPDDVRVLRRKDLADWIGRLGQIVDDPTVETVFEAARRSTTWKPGA